MTALKRMAWLGVLGMLAQGQPARAAHPLQRERAVAVPAVAHTPATAVAVIPNESSLAAPTPMVGLQVRLPNGVQLDLGGTSLQQLPTLVQMLSRLPCSASTKG